MSQLSHRIASRIINLSAQINLWEFTNFVILEKVKL